MQDNPKSCLQIQQIVDVRILEWFLKDYAILKTGVMAAENVAFPSQE